MRKLAQRVTVKQMNAIGLAHLGIEATETSNLVTNMAHQTSAEDFNFEILVHYRNRSSITRYELEYILQDDHLKL